MNKKTSFDRKDYLKILYETRKYAGEQYDKLIVYLSSGALVLTVGFIENVVDLSKINDLFLLYSSWICFSTSLIIILISHRTSLLSIDLQIKGKEETSDLWNAMTNILNWLSVIALVIGIVSFIIFVSMAFSIEGG